MARSKTADFIDTRSARENAPDVLLHDGAYRPRPGCREIELKTRALPTMRDRVDVALRLLETLDEDGLTYVRNVLNELWPAERPDEAA